MCTPGRCPTSHIPDDVTVAHWSPGGSGQQPTPRWPCCQLMIYIKLLFLTSINQLVAIKQLFHSIDFLYKPILYTLYCHHNSNKTSWNLNHRKVTTGTCLCDWSQVRWNSSTQHHYHHRPQHSIIPAPEAAILWYYFYRYENVTVMKRLIPCEPPKR